MGHGADVSVFDNDWTIVENEAKRNVMLYECCPEPYISITYNIKFTRNLLQYQLKIFSFANTQLTSLQTFKVKIITFIVN